MLQCDVGEDLIDGTVLIHDAAERRTGPAEPRQRGPSLIECTHTPLTATPADVVFVRVRGAVHYEPRAGAPD